MSPLRVSLLFLVPSLLFGADAAPKKESSSEWVFSLLPKSMQKNPRLELTVITEMTEAGKKLPPVSAAAPAYFELFTTGPDAVVRLGRGTLAPGAPGDVTIFSTDVEWTYDVNQSHSRSRNSPFHGKSFKGGPMATVVNGEIIWKR